MLPLHHRIQAACNEPIVFSGALGAPHTPLLPAPGPPEAADIVVSESTCGDRRHESREHRRERLQTMCEHAFGNRGTLLIPAFGIGHARRLLYELEATVHEHRRGRAAPCRASLGANPQS